MRSFNRFLLFTVALSFLSNAHAVSTFDGDLTLFQGRRELREQNLSQQSSVDDSVVALGLGGRLDFSPIFFSFRGRGIGGYSKGLSLPDYDPGNLDLNPPKRFLDLDKELIKSQNKRVNADFEKLYFSYQDAETEISIGRRAIGIGTLKYLPIWNRFSPSITQIGGPNFIYNPDNVQATYQAAKASLSAIHVQGHTVADNIDILESAYYFDWLELHFLGGYWWQSQTFGTSFIKDIDGLTLKGEALTFFDSEKDEKRQFQAGLGIEYGFNSKVSFALEGMYSSLPAINISEYLNRPKNKFSILTAKSYAFLNIEVIPVDFWKISLGSLINVSDGSLLGIGEVKHSVSNNLDLSLQVKEPIGSADSEFGENFFKVNQRMSFGYARQYSLLLSCYF